MDRPGGTQSATLSGRTAISQRSSFGKKSLPFIRRSLRHVRFTLDCRQIDASQLTGASCQKRTNAPHQNDLYSITSSARAIRGGGISKPSALAVLRLMTSSYLVGACTGRSAGFSPLRMRSNIEGCVAIQIDQIHAVGETR